MGEVEFVVAMAKGGIIGRDGGLPWHIPSELKRFKQATMGKPIIMGRKTWESLPRRPLPGRHNIIITRQAGYQAEGGTVVTSKSAAMAAAGAGAAPQLVVIGGGEIFSLFMPEVVRIYLTIVDMAVDGDTHFPALQPHEWRTETLERVADDKEAGTPAYEIHKLERVRHG